MVVVFHNNLDVLGFYIVIMFPFGKRKDLKMTAVYQQMLIGKNYLILSSPSLASSSANILYTN